MNHFLQRRLHCLGGGKSAVGVFLEGFVNDLFEVVRNVFSEALDWIRRVVKDGGDRQQLTVVPKWSPARQQLVKNDSQREEVGAPVQRLPPNLLRRHVRELAFDCTGLCLVGARGRFCHTKIDQFDLTVLADQDVLWGRVPMNQIDRSSTRIREGVSVVQSSTRIGYDSRGRRRLEPAALLQARVQDDLEIVALDVLHGDVVIAARLTQVVDLYDMRVL